MDKFDRIRELAGVEETSTEPRKPLNESKKDQLKEAAFKFHPIRSGGQHTFFLVTNATPVSTLGDVISEVDVAALASIAIGAGLKAVKEEKWELFSKDQMKEAMELAKKRLLAAKKSASEEEEVYAEEDEDEEEITDKKVSKRILTALGHIIKHLDGQATLHHKNHDRDLTAVYLKDASAYQTLLNHLKQNKLKAAAKAFANMDTAAKDYIGDEKLVPELFTRRKLAKLLSVDLMHAEEEESKEEGIENKQDIKLPTEEKPSNEKTNSKEITIESADSDVEKKNMTSNNKVDTGKKEDKKAEDFEGSFPGRCHEEKVKVPDSVKASLKKSIKEAQDLAKDAKDRNDDETHSFYTTLVDALVVLQKHLDEGTIECLKMAQIDLTKLMGPMLHFIPVDVVDFIARGDNTQHHSLKDLFLKIKEKNKE